MAEGDSAAAAATTPEARQSMLARLAEGCLMLKYCASEQPHPRLVRLDAERRVLIWHSPTKSLQRTTIAISDIKEIRRGQRTERFALYPWEERDSWSFSVIHGASFTTLDLITNSPEEREEWVAALQELMAERAAHRDAGPSALEQQQAWATVDRNRDGLLSLDEVGELLRVLSINIPKRIMVNALVIRTSDAKNGITVKEFGAFYKNMRFRPDLAAVFTSLAVSKPLEAKLTVNEMRDFCVNTQRMAFADDDEFQAVIRLYTDSTGDVTRDGFIRFLEGPHAALFDEGKRLVHHDMDRPLHEYFINASHNTYLIGHQLHGKSSVDGYIRALLLGCRCVELDCWDGPGDQPLVYHGHTLTSRILFRDAIKAIHEYAFKASPYPVILSLENHCSLRQQVVMAQTMIKIFGDRLVREPLAENETCLPSPEQLRFRILVKNKKLPPASDGVSSPSAVTMRKTTSGGESDDSDDEMMDDLASGSSKARDDLESDPSAVGVAAMSTDGIGPPLAATTSDPTAGATVGLAMAMALGTGVGPVMELDAATTNRRAQNTRTLSADVMLRTAGRPKAVKLPLARELSDLVVYCKARKLPHGRGLAGSGVYDEMYSIGERKAELLVKVAEDNFRRLTRVHNVRIYPSGSRVDSSNYDPRPHWACGAQMVALNFQTVDLPMHLNLSRFEMNARTGYVLKPPFLRDALQPPAPPVIMSLQVVSALQLPFPYGAAKGATVVNSFVEVEVYEIAPEPKKFQTGVVQDNGWNPKWNTTFDVPIEWPELAFVRFVVQHLDGSRASLLGLYTVPFEAIGQGYRHLPLFDATMNRIPYASVHVYISLSPGASNTVAPG